MALLSGAAMIAHGVAPTRTGHQEAAHHSTTPLKPLHGIGLHAVVVLPAVARLLSRTSWSAPAPRRPGAPARRRAVWTVIACRTAAALTAGLWGLLNL